MKTVVFFIGGCMMMLPIRAQESSEGLFTAKIGGGFTTPVYTTGRQLDNGWNVTAGAGVNLGSHFGVLGEFMFNDLGINSGTLNNLGFPGGNVHLSSFTIDPKINLIHHRGVSVYLIGGGGVYHRYTQFTAPTSATVTLFDPFFGVFYPAAIPATQVLDSYSVTKGGVNGGAGLSFRLAGHMKLYMEARYHQMYTSPKATTVLPVTFGFSW